jgi:hypothetical protein
MIQVSSTLQCKASTTLPEHMHTNIHMQIQQQQKYHHSFFHILIRFSEIFAKSQAFAIAANARWCVLPYLQMATNTIDGN